MMMPDVDVRKCKGFPHHFVTEDGRVWSGRSGRFLTPSRITPRPDYPEQQYLRVNLAGKTRYVHQLVAEAWMEAPVEQSRVRILDRLCLTSEKGNLAWESYKDIAPPSVSK